MKLQDQGSYLRGVGCVCTPFRRIFSRVATLLNSGIVMVTAGGRAGVNNWFPDRNWKSSPRIVTKLWDLLPYLMSKVPIDFGVIPKKFKVKVAKNFRKFHSKNGFRTVTEKVFLGLKQNFGICLHIT